jgi:hypothetical protein
LNKLITFLTLRYLDISIFIIRFVIFTLGANNFISTNFQSSMIVGFLVCLLILFLDFFFSKYIEKINTPYRYKRKIYSLLIARFILAIILGFLSGTSIHSMLISENTSNLLLNGKAQYFFDLSLVFYLIVLLFVSFEFLFVLVKYWTIKRSNDELLEYKIYLSIFNNRYLPSSEKELFIKIIRSLKNREQEFNSMRMILESMLKNLNTKEVIPNELFHTNGGPNLANCGRYLRMKEISVVRNGKTKIISANDSFPELIGISFNFVLEFSNKLSHHNNLKVTNNLYRSVIYSLLDCMLWFKDEIDKSEK